MFQSFIPRSINLWIFKIEPQLCVFTLNSLDIFWGGVDLPRRCRYDRVTTDFIEENEFNQQFWLTISPTCICGTPLYYLSLQKKEKTGWSLIDSCLFEFDSASSQTYPERYYGNEDGKSPFHAGCSISWPFDTRVENRQLERQLDFWSFGSETVQGTRFDFHLYKDDAPPICPEFSCNGRDPGWYVSLVLRDVSPDVNPPQSLPTLPSSP